MIKITMVASLFSGLLLTGIYTHEKYERTPANNQNPFELSIQSMALDSLGKIKDLEGAYIRATFNESKVVEFFNNAPIAMARGERKQLDAKFEIDPNWIQNDNLEFKLEVVQASGDHVVIRCAQVSKGLSEYNRSYQCNVPGEKTAVLTYRLARKGDPIGGSPVAKL